VRPQYNAVEPGSYRWCSPWIITKTAEIETLRSKSSAPVSAYLPATTSMRGGRARRLGIVEVGQRSIRNFIGHSMPTYASALAYQGLFALFPFVIFLGLLVVVLQVDGFFDRLIEQARSQPSQQLPGLLQPVVEQAQSSLPEEAFAPVAERLVTQSQEVAESKLLPFGIVFFAIWSASGVAWTLFEALNVVHEVEETRPFWKRFLLSLVFAPALGVMVIVGAGLLLIGPQLAEWLAGRIGLDEAFVALWWWLRIPVALLLLMLAVSVVYYFVPNTNRPFRFVAPGAVVAVIVWALALLGFSFYLSNFANYGAVYGSLAAAVALLVYLYLSAAALLLGAEVNEAVYRSASETEGAGGG
jgi:membrane protein